MNYQAALSIVVRDNKAKRLKRTAHAIVQIFRQHIGKEISEVMEQVNVTDSSFSEVFAQLSANGVPNSNQTIITDSLISSLESL